MLDRISRQYESVVKWIEGLLALIVFGCVVVFAIHSIAALVVMDWRTTETYYELIHRVLLLVIGLELGRTLVVRDLMAILDLLAFVIARKMLRPDLTTPDIVLTVLAFVVILIARHFLVVIPSQRKNEKSKA